MAFRTANFGGVADGTPQRVMVSLASGETHGRMGAPPQSELPWTRLALTPELTATSTVWAFQLGKFDAGYDLRHRYTLLRLTPGRRYRLSWSLSQAAGADLHVAMFGAARESVLPIADFSYTPGAEPHTAAFTFVAKHPSESLDLATPGSAILQGMSLLPV